MPKLIIILIITLLGGLLALQDSFSPPKGMISTKNITAETVSDPIFKDINGNQHNLHQYKGKTIVLNFWATWCPPCVVEFPQLLQLANQEQENITLITLSVDEDPTSIERFFKTLPKESQEHLKLNNVVIGLDTDKSISKDIFKTTMYPETFIINKNLVIKHKIEGITDWLGIEMQRLIK